MLKTLSHCSPSCDLRKVCYSSSAALPRTRTFGNAFREYCRHTRWWAAGAMAAAVVAAAIVLLLAGAST